MRVYLLEILSSIKRCLGEKQGPRFVLDNNSLIMSAAVHYPGTEKDPWCSKPRSLQSPERTLNSVRPHRGQDRAGAAFCSRQGDFQNCSGETAILRMPKWTACLPRAPLSGGYSFRGKPP